MNNFYTATVTVVAKGIAPGNVKKLSVSSRSPRTIWQTALNLVRNIDKQVREAGLEVRYADCFVYGPQGKFLMGKGGSLVSEFAGFGIADDLDRNARPEYYAEQDRIKHEAYLQRQAEEKQAVLDLDLQPGDVVVYEDRNSWSFGDRTRRLVILRSPAAELDTQYISGVLEHGPYSRSCHVDDIVSVERRVHSAACVAEKAYEAALYDEKERERRKLDEVWERLAEAYDAA